MGINRKSTVLYSGCGFLSSARWPSLPKKHHNGLINQSENKDIKSVHYQKLMAGHASSQQQGSYKKQDLKIKDFFQHLIILFQDHFIFIESAFNIAMQKWVLRKQDTL